MKGPTPLRRRNSREKLIESGNAGLLSDTWGAGGEGSTHCRIQRGGKGK